MRRKVRELLLRRPLLLGRAFLIVQMAIILGLAGTSGSSVLLAITVGSFGLAAHALGRWQQHEADAADFAECRKMVAETRKLLAESYTFEIYAFDMRPDSEYRHVLIQSRVSVN